MAKKILQKIPDKERLWVSVQDESGRSFFVSSTQDRSWYLLYEQTSSGYEILSKAHTPKDFYSMIGWR